MIGSPSFKNPGAARRRLLGFPCRVLSTGPPRCRHAAAANAGGARARERERGDPLAHTESHLGVRAISRRGGRFVESARHQVAPEARTDAKIGTSVSAFGGGSEDGLWRGMSMRPVVVTPWCDTVCAGGPPRAGSRSLLAFTAPGSSTHRGGDPSEDAAQTKRAGEDCRYFIWGV